MTWSEQVKYVRAKLKITQKQLSKETGIAEITIIKWETETTPKPRMICYGKFMDFCEEHGFVFEDGKVIYKGK